MPVSDAGAVDGCFRSACAGGRTPPGEREEARTSRATCLGVSFTRSTAAAIEVVAPVHEEGAGLDLRPDGKARSWSRVQIAAVRRRGVVHSADRLVVVRDPLHADDGPKPPPPSGPCMEWFASITRQGSKTGPPAASWTGFPPAEHPAPLGPRFRDLGREASGAHPAAPSAPRVVSVCCGSPSGLAHFGQRALDETVVQRTVHVDALRFHSSSGRRCRKAPSTMFAPHDRGRRRAPRRQGPWPPRSRPHVDEALRSFPVELVPSAHRPGEAERNRPPAGRRSSRRFVSGVDGVTSSRAPRALEGAGEGLAAERGAGSHA